MTAVILTHSLELYEVEARFGLQQSIDPAFFSEWQGVTAELDERDRDWLDKAKSSFLSLIEYRLHEEIVKLSILAPLLAVSGLGSAPFLPITTSWMVRCERTLRVLGKRHFSK